MDLSQQRDREREREKEKKKEKEKEKEKERAIKLFWGSFIPMRSMTLCNLNILFFLITSSSH
jgi:hypothetical protein